MGARLILAVSVPGLVALVVAGLPAGAQAASADQVRSNLVRVTLDTIAYTCFDNTTPSCPLPLASDTTRSGELVLGFADLADSLATEIGTAMQTSTLTPTDLDATGEIRLVGYSPIACASFIEPTCPFPLVVSDYSGDAEAVTDVLFHLDEPGEMIVAGSVHLWTNSYDGPFPFSDPPVGTMHLEVGPDGGVPLHSEFVSITGSSTDLSVDLDRVIALPAGLHRLRFRVFARVGTELFPGSAGFISNDIKIDYQLHAGVADAVPLPVAGGLGRGLLVVSMLILTAWRQRHAASPFAA